MLIFFWVSWLTAILVAVMPVLYFLAFGWGAREAEFLNKVRVNLDHSAAIPGAASDNRLPGHEMREYFNKFWSKGQAEYLERHPQIKDLLRRPPTLPSTFWARPQPPYAPGTIESDEDYWRYAYREMFRARYRELIGRGRYYLPFLLLVVVVATLSGLVVVTDLRVGYEQFVQYFTREATFDAEAIKAGVTIGHKLAIDRLDMASLNRAVFPFPPIHLSAITLAAITGAYLFVLTQLIQQCRARTLVYSDLFSASLRLLISVPLGLSVATISPTAEMAPFVSFAFGAFPIREFTAIVRRLLGMLLKFNTRDIEDDTIAMLGVTRSVSDVLAEENITCAQQLADIDPVVLAVRTGLSFDYVLFLAAQSMVWCFFGKTAGLLGPLGYCDARAIWFLLRQPAEIQVAVLESLAAALAMNKGGGADAVPGKAASNAADTSSGWVCIDARLLHQVFSKIAIDPYTIFLVDFTSNLAGDTVTA